METNAVIQQRSLGFPWDTTDPFLLCVHHDDAYPRGNAQLRTERFARGTRYRTGFRRQGRLAHVPRPDRSRISFAPHRGFETVTIVRKGLIDHADSLGAAARFGNGDVQWLTAGRGVVHSEMFPLLRADQPNPLELFQIWLNLPAASKMAAPHFTMFWSEDIPRHESTDAHGRVTEVTCIAGQLAEAHGAVLPPPPHSWAANPTADVAIWTIKMAPHARWLLPAAANAASRRNLYFFKGAQVTVGGQVISEHAALELGATQAVELINGDETSEFLLLQGRPINETGRAIRTVRDEQPAGDRTGIRGLQSHAFWRLAMAGPSARARTRARAVCGLRRWTDADENRGIR